VSTSIKYWFNVDNACINTAKLPQNSKKQRLRSLAALFVRFLPAKASAANSPHASANKDVTMAAMTMPQNTTINPQDWDSLVPHINALLEAPLSAITVAPWLERWSDFCKILYQENSRINRAKSEDTTDGEIERQYIHFVTEIIPNFSVEDNKLNQKLLAVADYAPSESDAMMYKRLRNEVDLFREANVPLFSEINVVANDYDKLTGAMMITLDGVALTVPQAESKLQDPDGRLRQAAWTGIMACYGQDRESLNAIFAKLLALRHQVAHNSGLANYREQRWRELARFDYSPEDCQRFHEAIAEAFVPLVQKLNFQKAIGLGQPQLYPWDTMVDPQQLPQLAPFADIEAFEAGAERIFTKVHPEFGAVFAAMRDGWLDLGSRQGKSGGGFCDFFETSNTPYIFMNAVGTHDDLIVLLHEGGHAFHSHLTAQNNPLIWNHAYPMEFAEVASMSMELLASPYLEVEHGGFYSAHDAERARREHLERIVRFLPYMSVVDLFQQWLYSEAPQNVTSAELDAKWTQLYKRFRPDEDWSGHEEALASGWQRKLHIFHLPFYYIEYGLAQLGALQVWRNSLTDHASAVEHYRNALKLGSTKPLPLLFETAGAKMPFDADLVKELAQLVADKLGL
jgi:oligoendopeptidase F